jgi:hypothetical protein
MAFITGATAAEVKLMAKFYLALIALALAVLIAAFVFAAFIRLRAAERPPFGRSFFGSRINLQRRY